MDGILVPVGLALLGIVAVAVLVAAWEHRKRMIEMRRRLAWSEQSRFEAEQHAEAMEARVAEMHEALRTRRAAEQAAPTTEDGAVADAAHPVGDQAERHATLGQALVRMPHGPRSVDDPAWVDTEPMVGSHVVQEFAPTMPADLELELTPPPAAAPPRQPA